MRKLILAAALTAFSLPAFAQSQSGAVSQSGAQAGVNINQSSHRPVPSAIGPGLTASGLSCSGSASIGGSGAGWGISFGMTRNDEHCDAREDAKYMQAITGNTMAAKARLCMVKANRDAFAIAGDPCPQDIAKTAARPTRTANAAPQVVRSFNSMAECEAYARRNPGVACRPR